jgi:hypothetical protein
MTNKKPQRNQQEEMDKHTQTNRKQNKQTQKNSRFRNNRISV